MKKRIWIMMAALVMLITVSYVKPTNVEAASARTTFVKAAKGRWMRFSSGTFNQYSRFTTNQRVYYKKSSGKVIRREKITSVNKSGSKYYVNIKGTYGKYQLRCTIKKGKIKGMDYYERLNGKWIYSGSSSLFKY